MAGAVPFPTTLTHQSQGHHLPPPLFSGLLSKHSRENVQWINFEPNRMQNKTTTTTKQRMARLMFLGLQAGGTWRNRKTTSIQLIATLTYGAENPSLFNCYTKLWLTYWTAEILSITDISPAGMWKCILIILTVKDDPVLQQSPSKRRPCIIQSVCCNPEHCWLK